jgi:hypothetical protein
MINNRVLGLSVGYKFSRYWRQTIKWHKQCPAGDRDQALPGD